jgi:Helix-turn-helix domain
MGSLTSSQPPGLADGAVEQIRVRILPDGRMSRDDAARYLGHKPKTLAMWALSGKGPRSIKVGGRVFYFRSDLDAFVRGV